MLYTAEAVGTTYQDNNYNTVHIYIKKPSIIVFPLRLSGSTVSVYYCCFQQLQGTVHFIFPTNTSLYLESDEITLAHTTLTV